MDNENIQLAELTLTCFGKDITKPPTADLSQFLTVGDCIGICMGGGVLETFCRVPLSAEGTTAARQQPLLWAGFPLDWLCPRGTLRLRGKVCLPGYKANPGTR